MNLTALHFAAIYNRDDAARVLLENGADVKAETDDFLTPAQIAHLEGNEEVFSLLADPPVPFPMRRRFKGPGILCALAVVVTVFGILLTNPRTQWEGWEEAPLQFSDSVWYKVVIIVSLTLFFVSLALVNALDPGSVEQADVAFAASLRALPAEKLSVLGDEQFSVLRSGVADPVNTFRWCGSCRLWRPPNVSHCPECKRCFWRFDHHCFMMGNCIAARNHRFFTLFLVSGCIGWVTSIVAVVLHLRAHSELASVELWWPPRLAQVPLYCSVVYVMFGTLCCTYLVPFAGFHVAALLGNINTKMWFKPKAITEKRCCITSSEFNQLCCMPFEWRPCPQSLPQSTPRCSGDARSLEHCGS